MGFAQIQLIADTWSLFESVWMGKLGSRVRIPGDILLSHSLESFSFFQTWACGTHTRVIHQALISVQDVASLNFIHDLSQELEGPGLEEDSGTLFSSHFCQNGWKLIAKPAIVNNSDAVWKIHYPIDHPLKLGFSLRFLSLFTLWVCLAVFSFLFLIVILPPFFV